MNNNRNQRFKLICAAADRIVEETGVSPSEVTGYAVSMAAFDRKPNGDFYALFEEWLKLRRAVPGAPPADMPAEAAAELEQWTEHLKAQIMQRVTGIVRDVAGSFEQTTAMRVGALERLNADQARRGHAVIATLVETEAELGEAQARIAELSDELRKEREQVQRLLGRLDERDALLNVLRPVTATDSGTEITPTAAPDAGAVADGSIDQDRRSSDDTGEIATTASEPLVSAVEPEQSPAVETDHPADGQVEMPLATSASAHTADDAGDDRG
ncbi:hypothetical protein [Sphingomonas jeddahensis]|uniref:Uncharacterized protein n=1 Tax=Sphingomonas jeddahensis TaxID=1915074 RepID=A0A1V2EWY9_9SPHN|nr:hypothetical protein [Sphingomonas jeddahensis]ONF97017.1 hypothetical protein SPHI_04520 [Sphingomonas jeddahensis]